MARSAATSLVSALRRLMSLPSWLVVSACCFIVGSLGPESLAQEPAVSVDEAVSVEEATPLDEAAVAMFENEVRPLLVQHCYECHSAESDEVGGGLKLDTREAWMSGGELGPAIVPGSPDQSWLIRAVRPNDDALQMPPEKRLSEAEIATLERWVAAGAVDPRTSAATSNTTPRPFDLAAGREFWAFRPVSEEVREKVNQAAQSAAALGETFRAEDRLDWTLAAQWAARGITPASQGARADLLRRLAVDLTGLPPTYDEVRAFASDQRPDAWERQIDRLLASPRYGERWGRHWLDIARYADSNGMDENVAHGNAWRYRDWVVGSMNRDQPFDEFVTWQIAGDRLPATDDEEERIDRTIATGFLSLGPKVLAEVDKTKMELDIIDEQIETTGRALLGMTFGCARCHDHKFDPIRAADYYALAGIFKSTHTMESFTTIAKWNEVSIETSTERAVREAALAEVTRIKSEIDSQVAAADEVLRQSLEAGAELPADKETQYSDEVKAILTALREALPVAEAAVPAEATAMGVVDAAVLTDLPIHIRGSYLTLGEVVPRGIPLVLTSVDSSLAANESTSGRKELAEWLVSDANPLTDRVWVNRVWRWHFGEGIVPSTDNFGLLGDRPTHPELLDDLVLRFRDHGRSVKWLHRTLLTSAVYRRAATNRIAAAEADPENRTWSRFEVRRLESEAIRDSMLMVAGSLDLKMGGSLLHVGNREFLFDHTSKDLTRYDARVRSLYLPVIRNHLYDLFGLFDSSDAAVPVGDRDQTVVPNQALFLMNSPLVDQAARTLAGRSLSEAGEESASRITWLFREALARDPSAAELQRFQNAVTDVEPSLQESRWVLIAQTLLIANEALYVK